MDTETWTDYLIKAFPPRAESIPHLNNTNVLLLDAPITTHEIIVSLKKCKNGKSAGLDKIIYTFYKNLPKNWLLYLTYMFNHIFDTQTIPKEWSELTILAIHKKYDITDPTNYRLLSLINCIAKIFMQVLNNRIYNFSTQRKLLTEYQSGFRKRRCCLDNIFTLTALIQLHTRFPGSRLYATFIDFKAAFNSIDHVKLWNKLARLGFSSKILNTLNSFYSQAKAAVKISATRYSDTVPITQGVLQGEIVSPLLFALFLHDLLSYLLSRGCRGVSIDASYEIILLAYADDIVMLADTVCEVTRQHKAFYAYCINNKLIVNPKKSNVVIFKRNKKKI